ncbi:MAG: MTH938/NDUFAF3 family protein [Candidatus Ancaeobacter aquaticus]|nr:MTH938/NDUFAF3 family protein [Candidatus Ancaeobacter aquaticus]
MQIDSYSFGNISIDGVFHTSDITAYRGEVNSKWWRKSGHELSIDDLKGILTFNPKTIVVGRGFFGIMKVLPETEEFLKEKGITLFSAKTKDACEYFNSMKDQDNAVFAAHLTC